MKMIKFSLAAAVSLLAACGGGGSGDSFNSSFKGDVTFNGQKYSCPSQKSYDACSSTSNRDCSGCTTDSSNNEGSVIITNCAATSSNSYQVSQAGCIVNLSAGKQTGVCSSGTLKLLTGTGFTKAQVSSQGVSFKNGVTINDISIRCAA